MIANVMLLHSLFAFWIHKPVQVSYCSSHTMCIFICGDAQVGSCRLSCDFQFQGEILSILSLGGPTFGHPGSPDTFGHLVSTINFPQVWDALSEIPFINQTFGLTPLRGVDPRGKLDIVVNKTATAMPIIDNDNNLKSTCCHLLCSYFVWATQF